MTTSPSQATEHGRTRRAIAAHFAGRISPVAEASMRAHLPTCGSCAELYERRLVLAKLVPDALPDEERMARGLGLRAAPRPRRWMFALLVPAAATALFVLWPRHAPERTWVPVNPINGDGLDVRGGKAAVAPTPSILVYRITSTEPPRIADRTISAGDELAFAYANPAGKPYVMIFGVDEGRQVYWFHPSWPASWPANRPAPTSVATAVGAGPHELPDAIRHTFAGRRLTVIAAFSDHPLDVTSVEKAVRASPRADAPPALGDGIVSVLRSFEVRP